MSADDDLKAAMKQVAQAKIADALGGDVLEKMISAIMDHRDSSYGRRDDKRTALERMVDDALEGMIRESVFEFLRTRSDSIQKAVSLAMADHADKTATKIIDAFTKDDWRATLQIVVPRESDD